MMAQYRRIKGELPKDALLLFRLGDFYEMFFEDAQTGAQLLNVALTRRGVVPMCGIPFHAAHAYIARLLKAGRKVAICDQMEEARAGQLVKREVTQILSPGTHFDERLLQAERNNFLAAVCGAGQAVRPGGGGPDHRRFQDHRAGGGVAPTDRAGAAAPGRDRPPERSRSAPRLAARRLPHPERLRRLGVRAGDGAVHRAGPFQGHLARWLRSEEQARRGRRRRGRPALFDRSTCDGT